MSTLFATPLASHQNPNRSIPQQQWPSASKPIFPSPPSSQYSDENINLNHNNNLHINTNTNHNSSSLFPLDHNPHFDFLSPQYAASPALMPSDPSNPAWLSTGQLTPTSSSRAHHRESSLSSLGSVGPASPYTGNPSTSNPQVAGDLYHDYHAMANSFLPADHTKPLTPDHTPLQEQFLSPQYGYYNVKAMPGREDSGPSTPSSAYAAAERQKNGYRNSMPKLDRTMSDAFRDELYNPSLQFTSAAPAPTQALAAAVPQNDIFAQRLQAANSQHLSASHRTPLAIPSRERSPFRQGSPLAPTSNVFGARQQPGVMFGTASNLREQQKAESDARALQQQIDRATPEHNPPNTISPKDVDLIYHESEADAKVPLFSQQHQATPTYRRQDEMDDGGSQQSFGSMATSRRESAYSAASSHATPQAQFNFAPPAVAGTARQLPQQYPFVPQPSPRKPSEVSNHAEDFPATLASMESSSSEYAPEADRRKRPAAADTGTYTCTYHGCTLRFETPAKLQRHKREGHRSAGAWITAAADEGGMTSAAARNSQEGPHRCERINPSTGKPCNTIFSRPYDLTRHEDTIHNARKQKVRCHLCTEEKSFSRNDALTRHFRVCHPDHVDPSKSRRRGGR